MVQTIPQPLTFEEFLKWYPDDGGRYELIDGVIVEVNPTGNHEKLAAFVAGRIFLEIERLQLPYFLPRTCTVKPALPRMGYKPDIVVLNERELISEPLWQKASTIINGASAPLVVEVVSSNWRDDYLTKLRDYEEMGIPEYWIIDYLALGGRRLIGSPKQQTVTVYQWVDGEYQLQQFRRDEQIVSVIFPELKLIADQVFKAGE